MSHTKELRWDGEAGASVAESWEAASAVLSDDRYVVPGVPDAGEIGTIGWLRSRVSRFQNGPEHARRRSIVEAEIARLDPAGLREKAKAGTLERPGEAALRQVPLEVLAAALGMEHPAAVATAILGMAPAYIPPVSAEVEAAADEAGRALAYLVDFSDEDVAVARLAILIQGCEAMAALISAVMARTSAAGAGAVGAPATSATTTDDLLSEVALQEPPVRRLRRLGPDQATVLCDIAAANASATAEERGTVGLTFGYGIRPCPGRAHALALVAGVLDALTLSPSP